MSSKCFMFFVVLCFLMCVSFEMFALVFLVFTSFWTVSSCSGRVVLFLGSFRHSSIKILTYFHIVFGNSSCPVGSVCFR